MSIDLNQFQTPIVDTLKECANKPHAAFYTPGHKRGQGISPLLADLLGDSVFKADLPELPELDNLFAPESVIKEAQELAAQVFGASQTWFLVNGSSCGIIAAILATCGNGDKIILPRNVHKSAIAGLILSGAIPIFIHPEYDPVLDIAHSITPTDVATALQQHPDAKAVMMVYPTYYGVCGNIAAIAQLAHQYNIPLLVDEAHGAHFTFHPDLPISALAAGADLTVQSTHKVLGAFTQASMLHIQGELIDTDKLTKALELVQSSSPNYLLLASLDAARQQMALQGKELMSRTLQLADLARSKISQIPGLSVLAPASTPGCYDSDRTRLTVTVSGLGLTGFAADEILHQQFGITAELPSLQHLTFIISLGNTQTDIDLLIQGFTSLPSSASLPLQPFLPLPPSPPLPISPRTAFFSPSQTVPAAEAVNRISAETICPYPPGIPVLMPGETITPSALNYLQQVLTSGGSITGCSDSSLKTFQVVQK